MLELLILISVGQMVGIIQGYSKWLLEF